MSDFKFDIPSVLAWGGTGALAGVGARLVKQLADIARKRDMETAVPVKTPVAPVTEIPVEISPQEAETLERKGVKVKRKLASFGGAVSGVGLGALATLSAYGGWKGLDALVNKSRIQSEKEKLQRSRKRVEALLNQEPEPQDIKIAAAMAAAEDAVFNKEAGFGSVAADVAGSLIQPVSPVLGMVGVLGLASAFNRAKELNKHEQKSKAMRRAFLDQPEQPAVISMVPVVREVGDSPATQAAKQ
jgi:hypothetical protein